MSKKSENPIDIYNKFKGIINSASRNITNIDFTPINCFLIDNEWLNLFKKHISSNTKTFSNNKKPKQKKIDKLKPCKVLNNYEEVINYIQNNKSFEIVNEQFIYSIDSAFKKNSYLSMKMFYIGLSKLIICFKEQANIKYLLILISENQKRYYEIFTNEISLFNKLLKEKNENIFKKKSIFKNIRFTPLDNCNNTINSQGIKNSFNIGNNYNYNYNPSNQRNKSINNSIQNDIPEEENINIKRNENNNIPYQANSSNTKISKDKTKATNIIFNYLNL
jgi:hypothetical protein